MEENRIKGKRRKKKHFVIVYKSITCVCNIFRLFLFLRSLFRARQYIVNFEDIYFFLEVFRFPFINIVVGFSPSLLFFRSVRLYAVHIQFWNIPYGFAQHDSNDEMFVIFVNNYARC